MVEEKNYVEKFLYLPPFTNKMEINAIEAEVAETFKILDINSDVGLCLRTMLGTFSENKDWDRMLYICGDDIPLLAFISADCDGDVTIVDCYGNFYRNEIRFIKTVYCNSFYRYYNINKIFSVTPYESSEEFLKDLVDNYRFLGYSKVAKIMEMFIETYGADNAVDAFTKLKIIYRFFSEVARIIDILTEFSMGASLEMLGIKLTDPVTKREIKIEINLEKMPYESAYAVFARQMWRIDVERGEQKIKKEFLENILNTFSHKAISNGDEMERFYEDETSTPIIDQYMITMNRNFEEDPDLLTKCNETAERISEEFFQRPVKLSHFKNIVLWLREIFLNEEHANIEEVVEDYRYLYEQVKKFEFKRFRYSNIFSAAFHIYKHFDEIINLETFKSYKSVYLKEFADKTLIFSELIKTKNNDELLKQCFHFYFTFVPSKIFNEENLLFTYVSGKYQAFNYVTDDLIGVQFKFGIEFPLFITTIHPALSQEDD